MRQGHKCEVVNQSRGSQKAYEPKSANEMDSLSVTTRILGARELVGNIQDWCTELRSLLKSVEGTALALSQ
jgi:hypothetical protein